MVIVWLEQSDSKALRLTELMALPLSCVTKILIDTAVFQPSAGYSVVLTLATAIVNEQA